ncbi:MAG: type II secretion system protein [Verrucomicrobia bacterium]|nr:type II secretion system protein [Verrucomicrobiota bacterium]
MVAPDSTLSHDAVMLARRSASPRGFTLIELLVVIAIIAVLMGLLFPVVSSVQDKARKTQAASDCAQIVTAVKAYFAEYGKYPVSDVKQGDPNGIGTVVGDPNADGLQGKYKNGLVMDVLRAIPKRRSYSLDGNWNDTPPHGLNPRQVVYFDGRQAKDSAKPKNGFATSGTLEGCYFDPWGNQFMIFLDTSYKNALDFFSIYLDQKDKFKGDPEETWVRLGVGAASLGPDGRVGKLGDKKLINSDDVVTWR